MNKDMPCKKVKCKTCQHYFYNRTTAAMHGICHMKWWYEEIDINEHQQREWNFAKARKTKKPPVEITQEQLEIAKTDYLKKGGKITVLENPAYADHYNSFNIHSFSELGAGVNVSPVRTNLNIIKEKTNLIMR